MRFAPPDQGGAMRRGDVRDISAAQLTPAHRLAVAGRCPGHRNRTGTDVGYRCWASCNAVSRAGARHRKESLMRILALTILAVGMASAAPSARAQTYDPNYPVCLQIYQSWKDYYFECSYTSLAQCNMSASGRAAQCIVNQYYAGPKPRSRRYRRVYLATVRTHSAHAMSPFRA